MARFRGILKYEVDWFNDGLYTHSLADVTTAVGPNFNASFGTAKDANPERAVLRPLEGSVELMGKPYDPRKSTFFTVRQLRQRRRFRVTWSDGTDTTTLCTGWILNPKRQDSRSGVTRTRFDLEGITLHDLRRDVNLVQLTDSRTTVTARGLIEEAFGYPLESYVYEPTELNIFGFEGKAGEFISQYGSVAGAYPGELSSGGLGLHSPLGNPIGQPSISTPEYVISDINSEWGDEQIRNYAAVQFSSGVTERIQYNRRRYVTSAGDVDLPATVTIRLPALPTDKGYEDLTIRVDREGINVWTAVTFERWLLNDLPFDSEWRHATWVNETLPSALTNTFTTTVDAVTGETVLTVVFGNWDTAREWSWTLDRHITNVIGQPGVEDNPVITSDEYHTPAFTGNFRDRQDYHGAGVDYDPTLDNDILARRLSYILSFKIRTDQASVTTTDAVITNETSISEWEQRDVTFPSWFAFDAQDGIQDRIDALAQPRHLHTIDFPLWQRDAAKSKVIAGLDAGSYFRLIVRDVISGVDLAESVMVMKVTYLLGNGRTPLKRLLVIETGNPVGANRLYLDANPLFLDGNRLFLR